jgi:hypothetical protein
MAILLSQLTLKGALPLLALQEMLTKFLLAGKNVEAQQLAFRTKLLLQDGAAGDEYREGVFEELVAALVRSQEYIKPSDAEVFKRLHDMRRVQLDRVRELASNMFLKWLGTSTDPQISSYFKEL